MTGGVEASIGHWTKTTASRTGKEDLWQGLVTLIDPLPWVTVQVEAMQYIELVWHPMEESAFDLSRVTLAAVDPLIAIYFDAGDKRGCISFGW